MDFVDIWCMDSGQMLCDTGAGDTDLQTIDHKAAPLGAERCSGIVWFALQVFPLMFCKRGLKIVLDCLQSL